MLKVTNLRKEYDAVVAVDDVSFEVHRGELFGLLGPNGAGKTTTIRTVLNIIRPDRGEITFEGKPFSEEIWNTIGYLPEERGLYRKSRIINVIVYFASLKGIREAEAKTLAHQWLERMGLAEAASRKVEELSKGNQQKIQLITAFLHRPKLLILDEPFTGLDPVNQILLKDILLDIRQQNAAIIFSTHQMEQVEKMCDNICLINKGRVVLSGALASVKKQYGTNSVRLEFIGDGSFMKQLPFVKRADVYQNYAELELVDIRKSHELLSGLNGKLELRKFEIVEPSLQSIFINVVGGPVESESLPQNAARPGQAIQTHKDKRVFRALLSMILISIIALSMLVAELAGGNPSLLGLGVVVVLLVVSVVQYMKVKRGVMNELQGKPGAGA